QHDHLPDYHVEFDDQRDMVIFKNRGTMKMPGTAAPAPVWTGSLDADVYADARSAAPSWDVHFLEQEWRSWLADNDITPNHPEKHFLKFCASWFAKRGRA